jgi:hypothetical protein
LIERVKTIEIPVDLVSSSEAYDKEAFAQVEVEHQSITKEQDELSKDLNAWFSEVQIALV